MVGLAIYAVMTAETREEIKTLDPLLINPDDFNDAARHLESDFAFIWQQLKVLYAFKEQKLSVIELQTELARFENEVREFSTTQVNLQWAFYLSLAAGLLFAAAGALEVVLGMK